MKYIKMWNFQSMWIVILFISCMVQSSFFAHAQQQLKEKFKYPPEEAKPRGYWIWAHGNFDYTTIDSELKAFKVAGLGGVDIFDMGIADPLDIIPPGNTFMSDKQVDGIVYALKEAKKLNLKMGLSVSNGWNAGGDWTMPDEKLMRLLFWSDTLQGPIEINQIGFPEVPTTFEKPYGSYDLFPQFQKDGFPEFYEDVALVAYPVRVDSTIQEFKQIIYFDVSDIKGNQSNIELPKGNWVLTRAVVTPLGQKMWVRSENSNGFIMDHYAKKATKRHFNHIINILEDRMGDLGESALERLYLASFEAEDYVIWSPELRATFYTHHGYEIDPYIPVFSGLTVIDDETTDRFLHDYRTTVSEMFVNNHYRQASSICREHGLLLASESGGPGPPLHYVPTEDLKALGAVDIMRGEFWNRPPKWKDQNGNNLIQVVKNIGSAAHVYGHKIVEMEAFTSHNGHWEETPWQLKILADRAFCEGMTRVVYHTMPHSPPEAGVPGWSYQAGTHIHPKMTWWPMLNSFNDYLARCSAMLMEGRFVADVVYYKGGEIPNFSTTKYIRPDLGFGYDYDDINSEVLLQITEVRDGRIILPTGMEYEVLVLPNENKMELAVLEKIDELIQKGATVIGPRPTRVYGLANYKEQEIQLNEIADRIWGKSKSNKKLNKKYGDGSIIHGISTREVLLKKQIFPDVQIIKHGGNANIDYIHRTTDNHEIFFIRNVDSVSCQLEVEFRVKDKIPEFWHPEDGSTSSIFVYRQGSAGSIIPMKMKPKESVFVVFSNVDKEQKHIKEIIKEGQKVFISVSLPEEDHLISYNNELSLITNEPGTYIIKFSDETEISCNVEDTVDEFTIDGVFDVRFPTGWGVEPVQQFEHLQDWTTSNDIELKYFSGLATYHNSFNIDFEKLGDKYIWILDLGTVGDVASVYLNGEPMGDIIFPPFKMDITNSIREGENFLAIEVANTWKNRLIRDTQLPPKQQLTKSNVANGSDPRNRPWSAKLPSPSGLIGPVKLVRYTKSVVKY